MVKKKIKAIAWDLDGTLVYFKIDFLKARRTAIKILKNYGIPKQSLSVKKSILDNIHKSKKVFNHLGYNSQIIEKILKEVDDEVIKIEHEAALNAIEVNGIKKVLEFAKKNNLKQAIYTYNTNKNAKISLETVDLLEFFDAIVGRDDVENPKPHPDHLMTICQKLGVNPSEIIVIGDTYRDIKGAQNSGAFSIAIETNVLSILSSSNLEIFYGANKVIKEQENPSKLIEAIEEFL